MSLTVACVFVRGNVPFSWDYVTKLQSMVGRSLDRPYRFVCFTDRPWECPAGIRSIPVAPSTFSRERAWWAKINLFDRSHDLGDRVLYLDLDTLIVGSLDDVADYPSRFALVPHAGTFNGRDGLAVVKRFNSSAMVWDADVPGYLYDTWHPQVMRRLFGDQDWIGEQTHEADTMPLEWFPRLSEVKGGRIPTGAKVILCKKPKNEEAAEQWPWFRERWQ
jgi:hypothetical protein